MSEMHKEEINEVAATTAKEALEPTLKPCRCGRKALIERFYDGDDPQPLFVATCEVCPVKTYDQFSMEEAARIWNEFVSAPIVAPVVDGSGWLLEKMHEGNVHYIAADNVLQWTDDPNKALRLSRREDAEALCTIVEDCEKIAEHGWPAPASPAASSRHYFCSCGGALTAEEYIEHYFEKGHDRGNPVFPSSAPAALRDEAASIDAERQAAAIVTVWRAIKDRDDKLLVRYIKQALLEWKPVAATTPPSTPTLQTCAHCSGAIAEGIQAQTWVHTETGLTTCRGSKPSNHDGLFQAEPVTARLKAEMAATEICDYCGIDTNDAENVAAIIERCLAGRVNR